MPKLKQKSVTKLKKDAWDLFSKVVRTEKIDEFGNAQCITCLVIKHWKKMQAGHFIPGRHNSILFHPKGCHVQCYHCNVGLKGNPRAYDKFMRQTYGQDVIEELERLDRQSHPFTTLELEEMITNYKQILKEREVS